MNLVGEFLGKFLDLLFVAFCILVITSKLDAIIEVLKGIKNK